MHKICQNRNTKYEIAPFGTVRAMQYKWRDDEPERFLVFFPSNYLECDDTHDDMPTYQLQVRLLVFTIAIYMPPDEPEV